MTFEKGNKLGKGRPPKRGTVIKRFLEAHPNAYEELLQREYDRGMTDNSMSAQYVMDRLKGKPGVKIDLTLGVIPYDTIVKRIEKRKELTDATIEEEEPAENEAIQVAQAGD